MADAVNKGEFKEAWALIYTTIGELESAGVDIPFDDKMYLLKEGARLARHLHLFHESAEINMLALQAKAKEGVSSFKYLTTFMDLADDYLSLGDYMQAREWVTMARDRLKKGLTEEAYHLIDTSEAKIHNCIGCV
ncbi:hypothetical protein PTSG_06541 [Salpingoeca rosetta]|uniref:Uncharacterized protein n=1 Tax=Salpingoeca rosetta (strain ATCC 50818 / BSB-021) TaxID=946362 RepID=F2UG39_SALR5|nr:uncharacterized protein PTSG_06541 [Salpingoeca rosetta]EGD75467.1 hypothetical protein PTSG_06541 [Salpingoeca rosetta]|eukprot:XP_004991924.1 hypothetical protein PTSG_06541 [Salpingoeca rosetta]